MNRALESCVEFVTGGTVSWRKLLQESENLRRVWVEHMQCKVRCVNNLMAWERESCFETGLIKGGEPEW